MGNENTAYEFEFHNFIEKCIFLCYKWRVGEEKVFVYKPEWTDWCVDKIVHFHYLFKFSSVFF